MTSFRSYGGPVDVRDYKSYQSGFDFAKLYYQGRSDLTIEQFDRICNSLKVHSNLNAAQYKLGFALSYRAERFKAGNPLPQSTLVTQLEQKTKESTKMGKLNTLKQQVSNQSGFVNTADLAEMRAIVTVLDIREGTGNFGPQWYIDIQLTEEDTATLNRDEDVATVSMSQGNKQRDELLKAMKEDLPFENIVFDAIPSKIKGRKPFIDINEAVVPEE